MKNLWERIAEYWEAFWFIRVIVYFFIIAVCLAILVQILKQIPCLSGSVISCVAQEIYNFFHDWAMVLSATVTFIIATAAFWVIIDNRFGRRIDRMQRLRNEIINWASDVRKALFVPWFERETVIQHEMRERLEALVILRSIIEANVSEIAPNSDLMTNIRQAADHLENFIQNLKHTPPAGFKSLETPWENLKKEFLNAIESAARIIIPEFR